MRIDLPGFNALTEYEQDRFKRNTAEIVCESFIFTADRDYLTARFAFFQKQPHLFLWSTAQAIEKYLKANILLLGDGAITKNHKHTDLATKLMKSHPERLQIDLSTPEGWINQGVTIWPSLDAPDFLYRIEKLGSPDVRYDQVPQELHLQDLVFLDRLAFRLRDRLVSESVQGCRLVGKALKDCFFDLNVAFAPADYAHPELAGLSLCHASVSTLEAALSGCYGHAALYGAWVAESMKFSFDGKHDSKKYKPVTHNKDKKS